MSTQTSRVVLVVLKVALSLVLLIGAGLMIKSFLRVQQVNPGFSPDHVFRPDGIFTRHIFTRKAYAMLVRIGGPDGFGSSRRKNISLP